MLKLNIIHKDILQKMMINIKLTKNLLNQIEDLNHKILQDNK